MDSVLQGSMSYITSSWHSNSNAFYDLFLLYIEQFLYLDGSWDNILYKKNTLSIKQANKHPKEVVAEDLSTPQVQSKCIHTRSTRMFKRKVSYIAYAFYSVYPFISNQLDM